MANITVDIGYGFDFRSTIFGLIADADRYSYGETLFTSYFNTRVDEFRGKGFVYDDGYPVGGSVTSWSVSWQGSPKFAITGINVAATKLVDVVLSNSLVDDKALIARWFSGHDEFIGGGLSDVVKLYAGDDTAFGRDGSDKIDGGSGNDKITGGLGGDVLTGGVGGDTFYYKSTYDSWLTEPSRDTILDFSGVGGDRIDLSSLDANRKLTGNQVFSFIGTAAFHGKAGELRYEKLSSDTYVYGDVNGDKKADFSIHLDDAVSLQKGFFFL